LVDLVGIFVIPNSDKKNIFANIFLVMKTRTPWITNLMMSRLKWVMAYNSYFTSNRNQTQLNDEQTENSNILCPLHIFPTVHHWNLSIFEKIIFHLPKIVTTIFSFFFSSWSIFGAS
jgi:hypothetical protein